MAPKRGSEGDEKIVAKWDDKKTEIFLKVCLEEIEAGNRPRAYFTRDGWNNIQGKFHERTSCAYDRKQLENKWEALKWEFSSFARMVEKETGVGWDHDKKTIQADEEWWIVKSKEDPYILKWKNGGPKFLVLLEKCFKGTVATGFAVFNPYQDPPPCEGFDPYFEDIEGCESNSTTEGEGEGDSSEVGNEVQTNALSNSSNINLKKRKKVGKREKMGIVEKLQRFLDRLIDGMDQRSHTTVTAPKPEDHVSYYKCLTMLDEVPCLVKRSHLYFTAVRILANKENRIAFFHFMTNNPEITIGWLRTFAKQDYPRAH